MKSLVTYASIAAAVLLLVALVAMVVDWWTCLPPGLEPQYVGREACKDCHPAEFESWQGSDHDLAMDYATPDTVLGNFSDQKFTHFGVTSRMFRRGDEFFIETEGPDGKLHTYKIKYTFGVRPLQQYMVEFPKGRVQVLSIAWDTERKRWFHLYPDERIEPDDWLHWTQAGQRWNDMCADCHSTDVHKNYDLESDTYNTKWFEIDVSCEACHGPASLHVEIARKNSLFWDRRYGTGLVDLSSRNRLVELEKCAHCHSRRRLLKEDFLPGEPFYDHYALSLLEQGLYHADGQIIEEVYVYGSFLQSRMYRAGVRCTDCHDPHSLKLHAPGNDLCTRCHLAGRYDTPAHHHHKPGTDGASCVECHMPTRTYMVVDPRRDHGLKVPRPDLTVTIGVPNVCNRCHEDESAEWARDKVIEWYGPRRPDDPHFAPVFAAAWAGEQSALNGLIRITQRPDVGPIVRATAAYLLGRYAHPDSFAALRALLQDSDALVRFSALRAIDSLREVASPSEMASSIGPLLRDPILLVRAEAARALVPLRSALDRQLRKLLRPALREYKQTQWLSNDQAAYHNLGVLYEQLGDTKEALRAYEHALEIDNRFNPTRFNLAMLYYRLGRVKKAEQIYKEILKYEPESADAYYSLGLLIAEDESRLAEAAKYLGKAAELAPERARVRYNYGLALQRLGRVAEAERELVAAAKLQPDSTDFLYAVTQLYVQQERWKEARAWADYLIRTEPDNPRWLRLARQIEEALQGKTTSD